MSRSQWFLGFISCCLLLACASHGQGQDARSPISREVGLDQHLDAKLPLDLVFRDEAGQSVRLGDYFGDRPVIVNFVYFRCPMLCTQVLNGLLKSSNAMPLELEKDYEIVSISIDPRETPQLAADKKERYLSKYRRPGGPAGWHFLTGGPEAIQQITQAAGFRYQYDEASDQYAHASGILVATPEGRISRYLYGIDYNPNDLRLALVESSENKIGTVVDQFLLLCYHYDPKTGKYGFVISGALRLAGTCTAIALGIFLWTNFRQERKRSREVAQGEAKP